jgi:hypothetical protein
MRTHDPERSSGEVPEDREDTCLGLQSSSLVMACVVFGLVCGGMALDMDGAVLDEVTGGEDPAVFRLSDHKDSIGEVAVQEEYQQFLLSSR